MNKYTFFGLAVVIAMAAIIANLMFKMFSKIPEANVQKPEVIALEMQCKEKHGQLVTSVHSHLWVECYQGKKKIWGVKL